MRSEKEMMELILKVAMSDSRIRAVYMNGSRANPAAPKDIYQDYDIVYVVTETTSFLNDKNWLSLFGETLIIQEPDNHDFGWATNDNSRRYVWLMLFNDFNRIDLTIEIKEEAKKNYIADKLTIPLVDKDHLFPVISPPSDEAYHVKRPTLNHYRGCCNEFWWCLNNVAKGIARDELPYAMWMFNNAVRDMLVRMLGWKVGIDTNFTISAGKHGKYLKKYLPENMYEVYMKTYVGSDSNRFWEAILVACTLFHDVAMLVADDCGFSYNQNDENGMIKYLNKVKSDCSN